MNLLKTSFYSGIAVFIKLISAFITAKILAITVGVSGFAFFGQFMTFCQMVQSFAGNTLQTGVVKYIAKEPESRENLLFIENSALLISYVLIFAFLIFTLMFGHFISCIIFGSKVFYFFLISAIVFLFPYSVTTIWLGVLNALGKIKVYTLLNVTASLSFLILVIIFSYLNGLNGALFALSIGSSLTFIIAFCLLKKELFCILIPQKKYLNKTTIKKLLIFSSMTFTTVLITPLSQISIRAYLSTKFSWEQVGYWQAVSRVSDAYLLFFTTALTTYFLPKFSAVKTKKAANQELILGYTKLFPWVILLAILIYYFREDITLVLYSKDFLPMLELYRLQLVGDVFKVASWLVSYLLLAKSQIKVFVFSEILFNFTFIIFTVFLTSIRGLSGTVEAFALNYFLYGIFMFLCLKRLKIRELNVQ